jgi:RNA-directed DNA polymerase
MRADEAETRASVTGTERSRRNLLKTVAGAEARTAATGRTKSEGPQHLMEAVVEKANMWKAYQRVMNNKGAPGVDELPVSEFKSWLQKYWPQTKTALLEGEYIPTAIRKVEIPKPQGGVRTLGIPTVLDRLIQQALHQVMQPLFEPDFSPSSYGFRPGRNAQQAVQAARSYVAEGKRWVVDMDLEKFFDRVNHDILMARVARKIGDERVLKIIRRYLEAGMMENGIASQRTEGTPQGGPLSPLLSNILLTDLDRELENRGHRFCRYADDCNVYVGSKEAGERVMATMTEFLQTKLKLKVNVDKSAVARPWERKFLGYSITWHRKPKLTIAVASRKRFKAKIREVFRTGRGQSLGKTIQQLAPILRGWINYFRLTEQKGVLDEYDQWIRHKLRTLLWRQWKQPRTRARNLMKRGLTEARAWLSANNGRGPWWNGNASHMNQAFLKSWFDRQGLISLLDTQRRLQGAS